MEPGHAVQAVIRANRAGSNGPTNQVVSHPFLGKTSIPKSTTKSGRTTRPKQRYWVIVEVGGILSSSGIVSLARSGSLPIIAWKVTQVLSTRVEVSASVWSGII